MLELNFVNLILILTSFCASFLTAAAGIGGGVLMLAVMMTFFPPVILIPIHGIIQMGSNVFRMSLMRAHIDKSIIIPFFIGSLIAALVGSQLVVALDEKILKLTLALFVLYLIWGPKVKRIKMSRKWRFYIGGAFSTFASLFIGASGPLATAFISRQKVKKETQVATHAAAMVVQHGLKTLVFGAIGFAFADYAVLIVLMLVSGFLGTYVGKHLLMKLPEHIFQIIYKTIITLLAVHLLYSSLF